MNPQWKAKPKQRPSKFTKDPEEEREFEEMRRKYAYAVAYLLINHVTQSGLRDYLELAENVKRYEGLKRLRQDMIDKRPRSKQWVDKGFYLGLKVGDCVPSEDGKFEAEILVSDFMFKQRTRVITNRYELDQYLETIARIIDSEKIWSDPAMQLFDLGERADTSIKKKTPNVKSTAPPPISDELNIMSDVDEEQIDTSTDQTKGRFV